MTFGVVHRTQKSVRAELITNVIQVIRSDTTVTFVLKNGDKRVFDADKIVKIEKENTR